MNPPPAPLANHRSAKHRWFWGALAGLSLLSVAISVVASGATGYFRLSSDTQALRDTLMESSGAEWDQQIALSVGGVTLGAVRAGLSFADLDAEARAALQTIRGVEVGIYQLASTAKAPDCAAMLAAADTAMTARGWDRVVGVIDGEDLVTVYLPAKTASARRIKCCVMVFDGHQMVVASVRANLEPILECVLAHPDVRARARLLAGR